MLIAILITMQFDFDAILSSYRVSCDEHMDFMNLKLFATCYLCYLCVFFKIMRYFLFFFFQVTIVLVSAISDLVQLFNERAF